MIGHVMSKPNHSCIEAEESVRRRFCMSVVWGEICLDCSSTNHIFILFYSLSPYLVILVLGCTDLVIEHTFLVMLHVDESHCIFIPVADRSVLV